MRATGVPEMDSKTQITLSDSENATFRFLLIWVLPVLLVAAFLIRIKLAEQPLWLDELHTAWVIDANWSDVAHRAEIGNQTPLFFYAEKLVIDCIGFSALNLRLIPIIASVAQVVVIFLVLNRWTGASAAGFVAALMLTINPIQLFAGTDARPYSTIGLVACIQLALIVRYWQKESYELKPSRGFDISWIATNVLLFYLHYTTIFWIASLWLGLCWMSATIHPRPSRQKLVRWLVYQPILIFFLCVPGLLHVASILPYRSQWSSFVRLDNFFVNLSSIIFVLFISPLLAAAILQLLYLIKPHQGWSVVKDRRWVPLLVLTLCGMFIPPVIAAVLTGWNIVFVAHWRYFVASVTAGFYLPGLMVGIWQWPRVRWMTAALIIAIGLATNSELLQSIWTGKLPQMHQEHWAQVSQTIRSLNADRQLPVVLCPGLVEDRALVGELLPMTTQRRRQFQHYCTFALDGPYRIFDDPKRNQEMVFARPTDDKNRFPIPKADLIRAAGGCFVVVRSDQIVARNIAKNVKLVLGEGRFPVRLTELETVPISLFLIEFLASPDSSETTEPSNQPLPDEHPRSQSNILPAIPQETASSSNTDPNTRSQPKEKTANGTDSDSTK